MSAVVFVNTPDRGSVMVCQIIRSPIEGLYGTHFQNALDPRLKPGATKWNTPTGFRDLDRSYDPYLTFKTLNLKHFKP